MEAASRTLRVVVPHEDDSEARQHCVAFNSTYPDVRPPMDARNVKIIVEVIKQRLPLIKDSFRARGPRGKPVKEGWEPCDHELCCSGVAAAFPARISVMRSVGCRTMTELLLEEMALTFWGSEWQNILRCPRKYDGIEAEWSPSQEVRVFGSTVQSGTHNWVPRLWSVLLEENPLQEATDVCWRESTHQMVSPASVPNHST